MSNREMSFTSSEAINLGLIKEMTTCYLDGSVSVGANAKHPGATYGDTTYADAIPTYSGLVKTSTFTIYEFDYPVLVYFVASVDCSIVLLNSPDKRSIETTNINTDAKVDALIATTTGKDIYFPTVTAGISATRITDATFASIDPQIVRRFAIKSNTAAQTVVAIKVNRHAVPTLIAKT